MTHPLVAALEPLTSRVRTDVTAIKTPDGSRWTRDALTPEALTAHVMGGMPRGVCPIKAGESTTMVALIDLDSHQGEVSWPEMCATASGIAYEAMLYDLFATPWRSSGGRGIHLYFVWSTPQDAYTVRKLLRHILAERGLKDGAKGVIDNQAEVFPKQDSVAPDGFGNQFILPLAGQSAPLDPDTMDLWSRDDAPRVAWTESDDVGIDTRPERPAPTTGPTSFPLLQAALSAIPNDLDYDSWRNIIFGIHSATEGSSEGLQLAHEFSARSPKYDPEFLDSRVWPYITDRPGGVTAASIIARAREHGFNDDVADDFEPVHHIIPEQAPKPRFEVLPAHSFADRPAPQWIIKNVLPKAELGVLFGESGSGKSFVALDMAGAIVRGTEWRGHKVKPGRVVYIAAEGAGGFRNRLKAYASHNSIDLATFNLGVVHAAPNMLDKEQTKALITAIRTAGGADVVIVDTFAQVTPGANENAGEDVGKALGHCRAIHRATGALVLLVHHAGKDLSKGARGWSGLRAAADVELEVSRLPMGRLLRNSKQKDGEDGQEWGFGLDVVAIGEDEDGEAITSCVVVEAAVPVRISGGATAGARLGAVEVVVNAVVQEMAQAQTSGIEIQAVIDETARRLPTIEGKRDTRKQRAKRALEKFCLGDEAPYFEEDGCLSIV